MTAPEQHQFQFRGVWVPTRACEALRHRQIGHSDLALLIVVDAFSRGDDGCFATNRYLARELGVSQDRITRIVSKLVKLKLLSSTGLRELRVLRTIWSQIPDSGDPVGVSHREGVSVPDTDTVKSKTIKHPKKKIQKPKTVRTGVRDIRGSSGCSGRDPKTVPIPDQGSSTASFNWPSASESGLASSRIGDRPSRQVSGQPENKSRRRTNSAIPVVGASPNRNEQHPSNAQEASTVDCIEINPLVAPLFAKEWVNRSQKLAKSLVSKGRLTGSYSLTKWADEFGILERLLKLDKTISDPAALVDKVLCWYVNNIGGTVIGRPVPDARSASGFRCKFSAIRASYEISLRTGTPEPVAVSKESQTILDSITTLAWTKGSEAQLPTAVEQSVKNFKEFTSKLCSAEIPKRLEGYRDTISAELGGVEDTLIHWFRSVWKSKHNWKDWSGSLSSSIWSTMNKEVVARIKAALTRYTCDPNSPAWDDLLAAVCSEQRGK